MTATVVRPAVEPGSMRAWILAARPPTLTAAAAPVLVGSACAHATGGFSAGPAAASLLGAMLLQIGANFANDVFDYEKGADTEARLGPLRAVQAGLVTPGGMKRGMWIVFGLAFIVGTYLASVAGWPVIAIGVAAIAAAIAYTGGPYPLGYHGLGDVFVMGFFGFVAVAGTAFVQTKTVPALCWWAAVPVGALATAILVVNNVRDRGTDVVAGKRTLPVRFGRNAGLGEYYAMLGLAYVVPAALFLTGSVKAAVLLPWATVPMAARLARRVAVDHGRALNESLVGTARLLFVHAALFALGIALGRD
jgi:1,4-dihydroxy-2-naphthoate octaprenyltransferase